jgi:RecA/RadA recombinase
MSTQTGKELLLAKRKPILREGGAVSTGCTVLNLACTDTPDAALLKGGYYLLVGDSAAGKTWLCHTTLAEANLNPDFDKYDFIVDDVEGGAQMDTEFFFGKETAKRIEAPDYTKGGEPIYSDTVESFYYHVNKLIKRGKPFIYMLDSENALTSEASLKKFGERNKAVEEEGEAKGSYGDAKAKYHSEHLRILVSQIRDMGSILVIVSQTRDNLGFGFEKKTRSGGRALKFYAHLEMWTAIVGKIEKRVRGKARVTGNLIEIVVKKNRFTGKVGKDRAALVPILTSYGIDDVGANVDFLIEEKEWRPMDKKDKGRREEAKKREGPRIYDAADLMFEGTRDEIVEYIEQEQLEAKVRKLVAKVWNEIEEECVPERKRRYE